jgi:hypothetical protein
MKHKEEQQICHILLQEFRQAVVCRTKTLGLEGRKVLRNQQIYTVNILKSYSRNTLI